MFEKMFICWCVKLRVFVFIALHIITILWDSEGCVFIFIYNTILSLSLVSTQFLSIVIFVQFHFQTTSNQKHDALNY